MLVQSFIPKITPRTTVLDQSFVDNELILVRDHMPHPDNMLLSKNGKNCFNKNTILDLFVQSSIDIHSKLLVLDSYMCLDDIPNAVFTSDFLIKESLLFLKTLPDWKINNSIPTKKLSAMMNKKRHNRMLLSMLLSNLFNINEIVYSSNHYTNEKTVLSELMMLTEYNYKTTQLPEKWISHVYLNNADNFSKVLYTNLFEPAAISLITEPTFYELGCHISEKTMMAIYSGHMMIWIGGWKSAEMATKLGLDVFDDVIDHSYQYIEHPTERSIEAVLRNLKLLNNLEYQIELKSQFAKRFSNNLALIRDINKIRQMTRDYLNDPIKYDYAKLVL